MPLDIEISADEWEAYQREMALIQDELFELWCSDMERDYG